MATEWMANSSGAGVYGLTLDVYGSDTTMDYQVRVVFEYTGSTAPDSYEYTAEISNVTSKAMKVEVTKVGGTFANDTDVEKVEFYRVASRADLDDMKIATKTPASNSNTTNKISVTSDSLDGLVKKTEDTVYALVYLKGVTDPIRSNTMPYTEVS